MGDTRPSVLFLCTHNAARSQMAEVLLRHYASDRFEIASAGLAPTAVHDFTRQVLAEIGMDTSTLHAKSLGEFLGKVRLQYAIIVCEPTEEHCPQLYPFALQTLYWPFADPTQAQGSRTQRLQKFREVRDQIAMQLRDWLQQRELEENAPLDEPASLPDWPDADASVSKAPVERSDHAKPYHDVVAPIPERPSDREQWWALIRFVLGCLQMLGAVISLLLLLHTGISTWTLRAVVITCVCTTVSVLLFGSHRQGRKPEQR
jgi:arsenate reductase (thioredoxin)